MRVSARAWQHGAVLSGLLSSYRAAGAAEAADLDRMAGLARSASDPWSRSLPLHFTASALVVHPPTARVLLRWHPRLGKWLQVGGHGDPGESDPLRIALREAAEETGLTDLKPWPDAALLHTVVCQVPASAAESAHEHADLRFVFATSNPDAVVPESDAARLRWLTVAEALALVGDNNIRFALERVSLLFAENASRRP